MRIKRTITLPSLDEVTIEYPQGYVLMYLESTKGTYQITLLPAELALQQSERLARLARKEVSK